VDGDSDDDAPHDRYDERPHDLETPGDKKRHEAYADGSFDRSSNKHPIAINNDPIPGSFWESGHARIARP
jgi:hypothetical protein